MIDTFKLSDYEILNGLNISAVYKIMNAVNGKYYIGCSIQIHKRLKDHHNSLLRGKNGCKMLQEEFNEYGDVFMVEIISHKKLYRKRLNYTGQLFGSLFELERRLIKEFNPQYNVQYTDRHGKWSITTGKYIKTLN